MATDDIYENFFRKLIPIFGPEAFSQTLAEGGFMKYSNEYAFKGTGKLSLKFCLSGKFIMVLGLQHQN